MADDFEAEDAEYEEYTFTPSVITENGREVIDYTGVESDRVLLSNRRDILSLPRPSWMPELDGAGLAADHYLPVTVHDDEGNYYLQSRIRTGEEENTVTNYGVSRTVIEPVYETKIYKLKLDVLVATVDYYIKHERAVLTSKAATPEVAKALCREVGIPRAARTMSWQRYLDSVALLGFCRNYRESEDPLVKMATERPAKKGRDRTAVGKKQENLVFTEQHGPLLQAFRDKKLDLNLQKQEYIDTHAKGEDTSYGNVNCWNTFRDEYGILIKKQNGKDFTRKADLEAIRTAVSDVWSYYGNLTAEARKYNLVLSYADNCKQHARKAAVGLFHPLYHAIGVSFFKDISDPEHSRMSPSEILVHETTHWLDSLKGRETHNWYASDVSGTLENRIAALYKNELRSYVKSPRNKDKKKLGDYWYRTCECLARAVEQDFALSHGISFDEPGYLPEDIYKERVQPLVKELLEENRRYFNLTMPEKAAEISEKKENLMEYKLTEENVSQIKNADSYTNEILNKIRAAGIEVITDKDEIDRILGTENSIQRITSAEYNNKEIDAFVTDKSGFVDPEKIAAIDLYGFEKAKEMWQNGEPDWETKMMLQDKSISDYLNWKTPNIYKKQIDDTVYGFVHNGNIYLNPELMNSNAAVQEYTHFWDAYTQKTNPELWSKGLNLFKDTKYWNEVISDPNYQNIKDDENLVLSEIHSRICGDIAEKVLERIAELDGEQVNLDAIDWDKETWAYIATDIGFHTFDNVDPELKIKTSELRDFLSTPMKDLMAGKQITKALHEHNHELSENGTFVLDGASNGMLSKYTGRTDISELEDFRNYASSRITGTAGDKSYFAQLYLLGQVWCREKGFPLPELDELTRKEITTFLDSPAPVSITAFSKALSETSPLPPSEPAVSQEESRPSVQSVPGTDAAGLPFNLYFNEEKGRYNIKFDPENNGDFFGDIVGELKANGWKYASSFKNWFPLKVEGSEEFAKSLLEKYSARIQASLDKLQEASAALGAALKEPSGPSDPVSEAVCLIPLDSAPARLKYFDRNHNESSEFMTYFNSHLSSFGPLAADLSEADASRILKALGHVSKSTLDEREERLALDSDNNPVIVSRTKDGTKYTQANLPGLIDFAVRLSEKTVSDTKAYLDQYDPAKIACGDMFRDIYADLYNENRLILNDIRDIASRYLSEESLSYEAVQNAKKAELERKHEPYVVVNWTERSGDEFIPSGTVYTLNEAETKLPELDAKFSQFIKADFSLVLPMPDASGAFTAESDISYDFRWDLGTGHPVASLNDYIMMCCSYPEVIEAYEENWKRVNVPGISDKRVSEIDDILGELDVSVRNELSRKLSSLSSALSEAKSVGNQVISDVNDYERAKKEVMKCKKEINDCYVKAALSAVRRLESSPIGYRTDGDENIHKYINHAIKNFINDLMYSESRKADNPQFDKELWEESLTVVEDITDEKLDAYLLSAEQWFKPASDAAVAFKERFEAEVRNDDCTRDGLYRISKKILGSFSKEQKSEISTWLSQEPFMSAGLVKTLASWLPDDLMDSFIRNEVKRPDGCEKIMPEKHDKKKNAGRDDLLSR